MSAPAPVFTELSRQIADCLCADRHTLRRNLQQIRERQGRNQPVEKLLAETAQRIEQSLGRVATRRAALPRPEYDDNLPVCQKRDEIKAAIEKRGLKPKGTLKSGLIEQLLATDPAMADQIFDVLAHEHLMKRFRKLGLPWMKPNPADYPEALLSLKDYETVKTDVAYVQDKTVSQIQAKDRILEYLKHKPSITNQKAQELCGFNKNQTYYILHQMCKDGILQPDGIGRGTKYKSVK